MGVCRMWKCSLWTSAKAVTVSALLFHLSRKTQPGRYVDYCSVRYISNLCHKVGLLLQNWRRINVALTRARHKLILIGSPFTLSHTPILSSLIQLISEKDWMIDVPPHIL